MKKNQTYLLLRRKSIVSKISRLMQLVLFIVCLGSSGMLFAQQQKTISGTIKTTEGETLPGVSILIKGTSDGTITNIDGNYTLQVPADAKTLRITYVGMISKNVNIGNQTTINVTLEEDIQGLEEVVVVGYGTQKKENLTGAVDVVNAKELANRPVANFAQALQGVSPNLSISSNNTGGEPGATQSWNIRGTGTLTGDGGKPYILVDGVPMNVQNINPDDIESITILKDAAASAIYGARAPYGVVLVTTKRGKKGKKATLTYSNNLAFSRPTNMPHSANSLDAALAMNYAVANNGSAPMYDDGTIQRIKDYQAGKITTETIEDPAKPNRYKHYNGGNANNDWFYIYFKKYSFRQKHNISLSGGSDNVTYYVSGGFYDQGGQLNWGNESYSRYNMAANIKAKVTDWFNFGINTKYTRSKTIYPNAYGGYDRYVIWHNFTRQWPSNPLYYPNGDISVSSGVDLLAQTGDEEKWGDDFWATFSGDFEPIKGWVTSVKYSWNNSGYKLKSHKATSFGTYPDGTTYIRNNKVNSFATKFANNDYHLLSVTSTYQKQLENHYFQALIGYEEELRENGGLSGNRKQLVTDKVPSISTATGDSQVDDWWNHWATQGVFGRLVYNYKEKYLFELNARYDGSSRFANADTQWGFFPSGSVGYNISKENFWEPLENYVNDFKIRGSYGSLGNQQIKNYNYIPILPVRTNLSWIMGDQRPVYTLAPGLLSTSLTWETSTTLNIGFDAAFVKNKLGVTFDWFNRTTTNGVGPAESLPLVLGTSVPKTNNTELETKGFELVLSWRDKIGSDFNYNVKFVLGDNKSVVKSFPNPTKILSNHYAGKVLGDIWGYESMGYFVDDADVDAWYDQTKFHKRWQAGDMKYNNQNDDEVIDWGANTLDDHGDKIIIGNNRPRYNFGITVGFNYKSFDFTMFWQGVAKRDYFFSSGTNVFWGFQGSKWQNSYFREHMDYWTPENTNAYYPRPYMYGEHRKNTKTQTKYLQNAAYARLKNVQLGYTLPKNWAQKVGLGKVRFYATGENLITITKMTKLFDPEVLGGAWGSGKIYPLSKLVSMGVNVTF